MKNLKAEVRKDRIIISGDKIMTMEKIGGNLAEDLKKFFVNFLNSRSGSEIQSFLEDKIAKEMFFAYFDTEFEMITEDSGDKDKEESGPGDVEVLKQECLIEEFAPGKIKKIMANKKNIPDDEDTQKFDPGEIAHMVGNENIPGDERDDEKSAPPPKPKSERC